jgi:hypothetical protein
VNTPAHAIVNLLFIGNRDRPNLFAPIAFGAILPDVPMFFFYLYHRAWLAAPERTIWSESYFELSWQAFFDVFNSLPLIALVALIAYAAKSPRVVAASVSMMIHAVCDLLLHHDDAHRHLFPFSGWRFESPVSYWDPRHYGSIVSVFEIVVVLLGALWLFKQYSTRGPRVFLGLVLACYGLLFVFAIFVWM